MNRFYILAFFSFISFMVSDLLAYKIDQEAIQQLLVKAKKSHTDGMVVVYDGKIICQYYSPEGRKPIRTMSVTKSIVNLAFGLLMTDGSLNTIDRFVYEWYPQWKQGQKELITLRQLLSHTSGIRDQGDFHIEIYQAPDFVKLGLASELLYEPGTRFSYSNKASNLLPGIFEKIRGEPIDTYLEKHLFKPLGINHFSWDHDKVGNVYGLGGLALTAEDLAKIGQLVMQRGLWQGNQLICAAWFDLSLQPSQPFNPLYGLYWWLIPDKITYHIDDVLLEQLRDSHFDESFIKKVASIKGVYHDEQTYDAQLVKAFGPQWQALLSRKLGSYGEPLARLQYHHIMGYRGEGWLGHIE